jgi:type VII secretion-associated protein (TIGR03931 family)
VTAHRTVIEAGPGTVRRLCCGTGEVADAEAVSAALDGIDDPVALVDGQPIGVTLLWGSVLRSLACPDRQSAPESVLVIHPSWWSESRVGLIAAAARTLADDVVTRPRSQLLAATVSTASDSATRVVVEIAARLVAITAAGTVAEARIGSTDRVAEAVMRRVVALTRGATAAVLIDCPDSVGGAALAAMIVERLRVALADASVELVDDTRLTRLAAAALPAAAEPPCAEPATGRRPRRIPVPLAGMVVLVVLGVAAWGAGTWSRNGAPVADVMPTTFLVEGRVALQVPAQWPVQRVTTGPGSARVEVISPSDPQVVLHVTQSPVPDGTLTATAESLKSAMERANAAEAGVFVDFNPSGHAAGRPAVTYREVREGHHIDWTVLLDGAVRISIGCQSRPGGAEAVRAVCEQAVRSARAVR